MIRREFWDGRRVLVTGHTGFKGSWLALWLDALGARVVGLSLSPPPGRSNFADFDLSTLPWVEGDVRDPAVVDRAIGMAEPEVVFHLAAQPLVRLSYIDPVGTIDTNVVGTAVLLERLAKTPPKVILVITSDKVYESRVDDRPHSETDHLGGIDPYSASKAAQDIVARALFESCFDRTKTAFATARSGNVIGGGDWSADRIVPDAIRAWENDAPMLVRNPGAVRPWQFILDPLLGYIDFCARLHLSDGLPGSLNFGPDHSGITVRALLEDLSKFLPGLAWQLDSQPGPKETHLLALNSSLARETIGWKPRVALDLCIEMTALWYQARAAGADMGAYSLGQIARYEELS